MGKKDDNKFYWFKLDKDKVRLQLKDIGSKFLPKKGSWKKFSIIVSLFVFIGIVIAVYTDNPGENREKNIAEPEIIIDYPAENSGIEDQSEPAVVYQKDEKFELATGELELKIREKNSAQPFEKKNGAVIEEEATFPVGPAPTRKTTGESFDIIRPLSGDIKRQPGWFYHPVFEDWRYQSGVVLAGEEGEMTEAVADGEIILIEQDIYYGIKVVLEHKEDLKSVYGYLKQASVSEGQYISAGEKIGRTGSEGLYFEMRVDDKPVDPTEYL